MADISQVKLPDGTTYNLKDSYVRTNYRALNNNDFDTINVTELNAGDLIVTGAARFLNTINADISGTSSNVTGTVAVAHGGTGATSAANARTNLGLGSAAVKNIVDTYTSTSTDAISGKGVAAALGTLDGTVTGSPSASNTLTAFSETDGKVSATFGAISITKSQVSDFPSTMPPSSHTHGNIQNGGTLQTNDVAIANGDKLVITDYSDSNKVARASLSFDGSTTNKALTPKGTWETFATTDTNTHRPIQMNGTEILGNNTTALNLKAGTNVSLSNSSGTVTIAATDTKYTAGTGLTLSGTQFSVSSANASTILNLLDTGSSTPVDNDYYISQYVNGGTTTTTYHRRPMSALWTYIYGKADSRYLKLTGGSLSGRLTTPKPINQILTGTGTAAQDKGSGVTNRYVPAKWTFNTGLTATDGDIITIKIPVAGHDYGVYLSIDNGTTYYPIVCNSTGRLTTHYPVNNYITLVYEPGGSAANMFALNGGDSRITVTGGVWRVINYYDSNSNDTAYYTRRIYPNMKTGSNKIFPYTMIMQNSDGRWESIVTSSSTGTSKARNTHGFRLGTILLHYGSGTYNENDAVPTYNIWSMHSGLIDHRYSFNTANNSTSGTTGYKPVYIVGSINATDGLFYLDATWWTQTLPTSDDGKLYIYIGDAYDYYRLTFVDTQKIYWYKDGKVQEYSQSANYAVSSGSATSATTASKLGSSNVGSATQPIYLASGTATACTYSLNKTVPSDAVFTDQYVSQSATTTSDYRKIVLSYQNGAAGAAVTSNTNVVYVTANAEVQPSTGNIRSGGTVSAANLSASGNVSGTTLGVISSSGTGGGISLYNGTGNVTTYGIAMRKTTDSGKHGYVQGDWGIYNYMSGGTTRGWVWRYGNTTNVASISSEGHAAFTGSVTIGANATNTSGVRQVYNSTTKSLDFVFVA